MAMQRTTEGRTSGYSRESAASFAIRQLRETFEAYPPKEQAEIKAAVIAQLRAEQRSSEFSARDGKGRRRGSELERMAGPVYGIKESDLR